MENHKIICFDDWEICDGLAEGSGRSEKEWLFNRETQKVGLFKYNKSEETTEHISESLASVLAAYLGIPCAGVDLGRRNNRIGSMSYKINKSDENIVEGISLITKINPNFNIETLYDPIENEWYSIEMCIKSLATYGFKRDFYQMLIFDYLIGNSDRHQSNWAILECSNKICFCPLYDHGSSLCSYENSIEKNKRYLGNDEMLFKALVDNRSKAMIRLKSNTEDKPKHTDVLNHIKNEDSILEFFEHIVDKLNQASIDAILNCYNTDVLSIDKRNLISKYLLWKVDYLKKLLVKGG